jgi:hypothetical protein
MGTAISQPATLEGIPAAIATEKIGFDVFNLVIGSTVEPELDRLDVTAVDQGSNAKGWTGQAHRGEIDNGTIDERRDFQIIHRVDQL